MLVSPGAAFGVLAAVQVTLIAAITVVVVALPQLRRGLGLDEGQAILVSSGYGLSFSGLLLLGSRLGERYGLRRCLLAGLVVFVIGSALGGVAGDWPLLIAARLVQGIGAAMAAPAAMGLLAAVFPDERRRARALASWGVLASVGAVTGTLAGGALTGVVSWRWCFLAVVAVGVMEIAAAGLVLPAGSRTGAARLDVAGALSVTGAVCLLSYGLIQTTDHRWGSGAVAFPIVAGIVLLVIFIVIEQRVAAPLLRVGLLTHSGRASALAAIWITAAATATVSLFCSLYFQQAQGHSPLQTTARLVPLAATFALAAIAVRPVVGRLGPRRAATVGLAAAAVGLLLLGDLHVDSAYLGLILAGLVIFPAAASIAFAAGMVLALDDTAPADTAATVGLANTAMETGPTIGLALLVSLAGTITGPHPDPAALAHGYNVALRAAAVALLAVALATTLLSRRPTASRDAASARRFRRPVPNTSTTDPKENP